VTTDAIADGDWDYVVLQEQSIPPADPDLARRVSYPAASSSPGPWSGTAATWCCSSPGASHWVSRARHGSYSVMQVDLADSYLAFADSLLADVAPVGMLGG
jgi:hypothetical protein